MVPFQQLFVVCVDAYREIRFLPFEINSQNFNVNIIPKLPKLTAYFILIFDI